jgi:hypothetical protein
MTCLSLGLGRDLAARAPVIVNHLLIIRLFDDGPFNLLNCPASPKA